MGSKVDSFAGSVIMDGKKIENLSIDLPKPSFKRLTKNKMERGRGGGGG